MSARPRSVTVLGVTVPVEYALLDNDLGEYENGKIRVSVEIPDSMATWIATHEAAHMYLEMTGIVRAWQKRFGEDVANALEEQVITEVLLPFMNSLQITHDEVPF